MTTNNLLKNLRKATIAASAALMGVCLIGAGTTFFANADDDEEVTVESVEFTNYTTVLTTTEKDFNFTALVTYSDGSSDSKVEWTSSNEEVIYIAEGVAYVGGEEGYAQITATSTVDSSYTASVWVDVVESYVAVESLTLNYTELELGTGWTTRIGYTVSPSDAAVQGVSWRSSNKSVATVDSNGYVTTVGTGKATIYAMTDDHCKTVECALTVSEFGEATLDASALTLAVGGSGELTVTVPDADEDTVYAWYVSEDSVASADTNNDEVGTMTAWAFGSTNVYVLATNSDGSQYAASAKVTVTSDFFYLTGLEDDWSTYTDSDSASTAGVLLEKVSDGVYAITREIWANDGFQILPSDLDTNWTTKLTPDSYYYAAGSDTDYVVNKNGMFMVNSLGTYTITLDLTQGYARVTIKLVSVDVTTVVLSVAEGSNGNLQAENSQITLDVTTLPENAELNGSSITYSITSNAAEYVTVSVNDDSTITITLTKTSSALIIFTLTCNVGDATGSIDLTILASGETYVGVTKVTFGSDSYKINVNNGAQDWTVGISATVNSDADVQGVTYSTSDDSIYIEYDEDGNASVRASALGTFTVTATAIGDATVTATAEIFVYSSGTDEDGNEFSGIYLIGILGGETVNGWTSVEPTETDYGETGFDKWTLSAQGDGIYSGLFTFNAGDTFAIAFLGMNGNWDAVIDNTYFDYNKSDMDYLYYSGINIEINYRAQYTVKLDLSGSTPSFTVIYYAEAEGTVTVEYSLYIYIVASGSAWNSSVSQEGNIIETVGYITMKDGVAEGITITVSSVSFASMSAWPTIQIVTATGVSGGYFTDATWYGSYSTSVTVDGGAYGNSTDHLYNGGSGCEFWWVGSNYSTGSAFAFTFECDTDGTLTAVYINYAASESTAE